MRTFLSFSEMLTSMRHHTKLLFISVALFELIALSLAQQRVAPGVPPSQYVSKIHIIPMFGLSRLTFY